MAPALALNRRHFVIGTSMTYVSILLHLGVTQPQRANS